MILLWGQPPRLSAARGAAQDAEKLSPGESFERARLQATPSVFVRLAALAVEGRFRVPRSVFSNLRGALARLPTMPDELQDDETLNAPPLSTGEQATSAALTEDISLAQLNDPDLSPDAIEHISRDAGAMKSRKVRMAVASHPHAPRRIALRIIRELYTFELMQFALTPAAAADLKRIAEELLVSRLPAITLGERISLARRSSTLIAGALLLDKESKVWQPALENARLTEAAVVRALQRTSAAPAFVEAVSHHPKWSVRNEVQVALLRSAHTPLAKAIEFARRISPKQLRDILHTSRLPEKIKAYLRKDTARVRE